MINNNHGQLMMRCIVNVELNCVSFLQSTLIILGQMRLSVLAHVIPCQIVLLPRRHTTEARIKGQFAV